MATVASMPSYFPMHWFSIHPPIPSSHILGTKVFFSCQKLQTNDLMAAQMQKRWWVVNGERSDVASSYSGARHSWPANCTAECCITALHCCCTMDQQCSVIQMLNGLVCATIEHRVITCMIVEHLSLSIKSCVGQCWVDCKALVGCTRVAGWVEGRAGSELLPALTWTVTIKLSHK